MMACFGTDITFHCLHVHTCTLAVKLWICDCRDAVLTIAFKPSLQSLNAWQFVESTHYQWHQAYSWEDHAFEGLWLDTYTVPLMSCSLVGTAEQCKSNLSIWVRLVGSKWQHWRQNLNDGVPIKSVLCQLRLLLNSRNVSNNFPERREIRSALFCCWSHNVRPSIWSQPLWQGVGGDRHGP